MKSMRTAMAFLCLLLTIQSNLKAQHFFKGIQVGIGGSKTKITSFNTNDPIRYYPVLSLQANLVFGLNFGKFGLNAEPGLIRNGFRSNIELISRKTKLYYHHIQLPVLVHYNFYKRLSLSTGPELYYLINLRDGYAKKTLASGLNKFGIVGTVSLKHEFSKLISIGLRYSQGLTNLFSYTFTNPNGIPIGKLQQNTRNLNLIMQFDL